MMKEKTIVCIGIFLILAVLTSCAFYYSTNSYSAVRNDMEVSGRVITLGAGEGTAHTARGEFPVVSYTAALVS